MRCQNCGGRAPEADYDLPWCETCLEEMYLDPEFEVRALAKGKRRSRGPQKTLYDRRLEAGFRMMEQDN